MTDEKYSREYLESCTEEEFKEIHERYRVQRPPYERSGYEALKEAARNLSEGTLEHQHRMEDSEKYRIRQSPEEQEELGIEPVYENGEVEGLPASLRRRPHHRHVVDPTTLPIRKHVHNWHPNLRPKTSEWTDEKLRAYHAMEHMEDPKDDHNPPPGVVEAQDLSATYEADARRFASWLNPLFEWLQQWDREVWLEKPEEELVPRAIELLESARSQSELLEHAWSVISNVKWDSQSSAWREAAIEWRDMYFSHPSRGLPEPVHLGHAHRVTLTLDPAEWALNARGVEDMVADRAASKGWVLTGAPQTEPHNLGVLVTWMAYDHEDGVEGARRTVHGWREERSTGTWVTYVPERFWDGLTPEERGQWRRYLGGVANAQGYPTADAPDELPDVINGVPSVALRYPVAVIKEQVTLHPGPSLAG
jgi:hypothetical protein